MLHGRCGLLADSPAHAHEQLQLPAVRWPGVDDTFDAQDVGRVIRVHVQWAMNRPMHANALLSLSHHLHAPFCMLHAGMRITEKMLEFLQVPNVFPHVHAHAFFLMFMHPPSCSCSCIFPHVHAYPTQTLTYEKSCCFSFTGKSKSKKPNQGYQHYIGEYQGGLDNEDLWRRVEEAISQWSGGHQSHSYFPPVACSLLPISTPSAKDR
jgi:hypothetical protein